MKPLKRSNSFAQLAFHRDLAADVRSRVVEECMLMGCVAQRQIVASQSRAGAIGMSMRDGWTPGRPRIVEESHP